MKAHELTWMREGDTREQKITVLYSLDGNTVRVWGVYHEDVDDFTTEIKRGSHPLFHKVEEAIKEVKGNDFALEVRLWWEK